MIVWPRIYLFRDHGSTKFTSLDQILSNINLGVLNPKIIVLSMFEIENINEALTYSDWTIAIQEELHKFERNKMWHLGWEQDQSLRPSGCSRTSWIKFRTVHRNKARLVVQRYNQEEKQHRRYGSLGWTLFGILDNQETTHQVLHTILDLIWYVD